MPTVFSSADSGSVAVRKLKDKAREEITCGKPESNRKYKELIRVLSNARHLFIRTATEVEETWQGLAGSALVILTRSLTEPRGTIIIKNLSDGSIYQYEGYYPAYIAVRLFYPSMADRKGISYGDFKHSHALSKNKIIHLQESFLQALNQPLLCPCCKTNMNEAKTKEKLLIKQGPVF